MRAIEDNLLSLRDPKDYFKGVGQCEALPTPTDILLFVRRTKDQLQQRALQNRSHHRFVLIFNLETPGHVHVDHLAIPLRPGQALLVFPYQFHHFSQLASSSLKWLICTFDLKAASFVQPMRNRVIDPCEATREVRDRLVDEWQRIEAVSLPGETQALQLQTVLVQLLLGAKQDLQASASGFPPEPRDNLLRSINRLMSGWRGGRPILVRDLAAGLHLSESRLRVLFKNAAGIPLGSYIQNYRLNRAMALLRTTDLSLAEIAVEAGFGSPQSFSRAFKQDTGQSPRAYRHP